MKLPQLGYLCRFCRWRCIRRLRCVAAITLARGLACHALWVHSVARCGIGSLSSRSIRGVCNPGRASTKIAMIMSTVTAMSSNVMRMTTLHMVYIWAVLRYIMAIRLRINQFEQTRVALHKVRTIGYRATANRYLLGSVWIKTISVRKSRSPKFIPKMDLKFQQERNFTSSPILWYMAFKKEIVNSFSRKWLLNYADELTGGLRL